MGVDGCNAFMYTIGVYVQHIILFVEKYLVIIDHLSRAWILDLYEYWKWSETQNITVTG